MTRLAALVPSSLRPFARKVRDLLRRLERAPLDQVLSPEDCRSGFEWVTPKLIFERRGTASCRVRVRNFGSATWSSHGRHPVSLRFRWLSPKKEPIEGAVTYWPLPRPVRSAELVAVDATLTAPDSLGHFLVEVDLVQFGGPTFHDCGARPIYIEAQVTGRDAEDIDYHKVYATADLNRDYWTVVGPGTKDEYDRLAQAKFQMLRDLGLTPDSQVLDVGCGTGQLGIPLEGFLSDRGGYFGTDIGPEAIDFCRQRFRRPNFQFAQNEMTALPIRDRQFDFITFFSVFTHTYPDETILLLAEAKRLLAPGGSIVGDVFTSAMVERSSGNRGAMELNREHFLRLVALVGLKAEVVASWPWQKYAQREVFRFTHATA